MAGDTTVDHTISTRWGGLRERYKEFPSAVSRFYDPFASKDVAFRYGIEREAWTLARFDHDTKDISHRATQLTATVDGKEIEANVTFVVEQRSGGTSFNLVAKHVAPKGALAALRRVAKSAGASVVVHLHKAIRAQIALYWRLDGLRQAATIHHGQGVELDAAILSAINAGVRSRFQLRAHLCAVQHQLLDARLAHLHCTGRVKLDFCTRDFGIDACHGAQ
jgi:hypothetical protein